MKKLTLITLLLVSSVFCFGQIDFRNQITRQIANGDTVINRIYGGYDYFNGSNPIHLNYYDSVGFVGARGVGISGHTLLYTTLQVNGNSTLGNTVADTSNITNVKISGSIQDESFINVKMYGAKGDGITNDLTAINSAMTAANSSGKKVIYFPKGTYLITSGSATAITISVSNLTFLGEDKESTIIKTTSNTTIFYALAKDYLTFINLQFLGTGKTDTKTTQRGIYLSNCEYFEIYNCKFINIASSGIFVYNNSCCIGGNIYNNQFYSNRVGIYGDNGGEYVNIGMNQFNTNTTALKTNSGNWNINGNVITSNDTGIEFLYGTNDSHSNITSNLINHNTIGFKIDSIYRGMIISCNQLFANTSCIFNKSTGVIFSQNNISATTIQFKGSKHTTVSNNTLDGTVTFTDNYLGVTSYTQYYNNNFNAKGNSDVFSLKTTTTSATDTALYIMNSGNSVIYKMLTDGSTTNSSNIVTQDSLTTRKEASVIADNAEMTLVSTQAGWGQVYSITTSTGVVTEWANFYFSEDGVVVLQTNSTNVTTTGGTDNNLNIYDGGDHVHIQNMLGSNQTLKIVINYSAN